MKLIVSRSPAQERVLALHSIYPLPGEKMKAFYIHTDKYLSIFQIPPISRGRSSSPARLSPAHPPLLPAMQTAG